VKTKVAFAVSAALMSMTVNAADELGTSQASVNLDQNLVLQQVAVASLKNQSRNEMRANIFTPELDLDNGTHRYIIRLKDDSVAMYRGGVSGLSATHVATVNRSSIKGVTIEKSSRLDPKADHVVAYRNYLESKQSSFLTSASGKLNRQLDVLGQTQFALNAVIVEVTQAEAARLASLPGVARIERDKLHFTQTDAGPRWIKADKIWDGSASGVASKGEGVIVGIIDTGINADNASFADVGADGYDHTNPLGEGVYLGDCATDEWKSLCNDKLIGVISYKDITDAQLERDPTIPVNGVDHNGHGSHTAGTTAGNVLTDVALYDAEGNVMDTKFTEMSGVAPHANVVSYQVCYPGENDAIGFSGCFPSLTVQAIDHAIANGVHVLNYSIGGGSSNPWNDSDALAFLGAREAGIHAATSAGNSGPGAATVGSPGDAPWISTVAAYSHDRIFRDKELNGFSGGDTDAPAAMTGSAMSGGFSGEIVYAGNFTNANDPDGDPAQCLQPFPKDTFTASQIVVCDRGAIARTQKGVNVRDGGAGAFVLANVDGGASSVVADPHVIPAIHINAEQGNALRTWLASGTGHMATVTDTEISRDAANANVAAGFTSRGPGASVPDILVPDMAAPGRQIFAAYADEQSDKFKANPDPKDFAFLSGTSMASPHVAGALALIKATRPNWTPAEAQSALMLTADFNTKSDDGVTQSTFFDGGAGMIQVDKAVQSGLVLNEDRAGYEAQAPGTGDPSNVNMASLTRAQCVGVCTFVRTVKATKAGTWTLAGEAITTGVNVSAEPASFTLAEGESQEVTVTVDAGAVANDTWGFAHLTLESGDGEMLKMPVSVKAANGNIPSEASITAHRNNDSYVMSGLQSVAIESFTSSVTGLQAPTMHVDALPLDSNNGSAYDDLEDGVKTYWLTVPEGTPRVVAEILKSASPDLDMRIGLDANGDGVVEESEEVASSATGTALEKVDLIKPAAGSYWVTVQNWAASSDGAVDEYELATVVLENMDKGNLTVTGPEGALDQLTDYDITLTWNDTFADSKHLYGYVALGANADTVGQLGTIAVDIVRGEDDVSLSHDAAADTRLDNGAAINYSVTVQPNLTPSDRDYTIVAEVPDSLMLDADSVTGDATIEGNKITWMLTQPSLLGLAPTYVVSTNVEDASCTVPSIGGSSGYIDLDGFGIGGSTMDGDTQVGVFNVPANMFGTTADSVSVTDDGFIMLSGDVGSTPYSPQMLPDAAAPNHLVAPLWRDLQIDNASGSKVSVATAGPTYTIIEFDDMRHYNFYNTQPEVNDVLDFEVVFHNTTGDFYYAYDNVTHTFGNDIPTTVGYENATGETGFTWIHRTTTSEVGDVNNITSGLVVCHKLADVVVEPTVFTFSTTVAEDYVGGAINTTLSSAVGSMDPEMSAPAMPVEVEGGPVIMVTSPASANMGEMVTLDASASMDPNGDAMTLTWTQLAGSPVTFDANAASISFEVPTVVQSTLFTFELTAEAGDMTAEKLVQFTAEPVINTAPTVVVDASSSVTSGATANVTLTATDAEGDDLTVTWMQIAGPAVTMSASGNDFSFTAPTVISSTLVTFKAMVSDGTNTVESTVSVSVNPAPAPTVSSSSSGSFGWLLLTALPFFGLRRRMQK